MTNMLEEKRETIAEVCSRYGVKHLDAFGSSLREDFDHELSDFDLLVEFKSEDPFERADAYFALLEELERLLERDVDLVMAQAVKNPYIRRNIEETKQRVYGS